MAVHVRLQLSINVRRQQRMVERIVANIVTVATVNSLVTLRYVTQTHVTDNFILMRVRMNYVAHVN